MNIAVLGLLALLPIVTSGVLLLGLQWPAKRAMPLVLIITAILGLFVWDMSTTRVLTARRGDHGVSTMDRIWRYIFT